MIKQSATAGIPFNEVSVNHLITNNIQTLVTNLQNRYLLYTNHSIQALGTKEDNFLQLLEAHKGILYKICKVYQDDPESRNDLQQEIILQLWKSFDSFRGDSRFSSWMYRVGLNTAIVFFKKEKRRPDKELLPSTYEQVEEQYGGVEKEEQLAIFYKSVQQLNKIEKALVLLYMEDLPYEEIAAQLGITPVNARVRLNRVKNKLKEIIKNMDHGSR